MSSLMTTIEVDQNAAIILHSLKDKAEAQGVSLGELLQNLAGDKSIVAASFEQALRNEAMLEALRQTKELLKDQPVRGSTTETLKIVREARAGRMWGDEPVE
ncbi:MAG TPA: hypothetical protein PLD20_12675 [Blastocatellia bacterium]|nr:hypothetical protein [Blastocatellia bacterium]HMV82842.1 hypothetical protein [Blastocatellia bacterium]HMX25826.1 hypothetical protein [Blastocatellia bacterium]HMY71883.1 hypothetical protein [Blastocatellia bacterium]HMZ18782.1 hypothetical protein [Blastocatellia bacterium]